MGLGKVSKNIFSEPERGTRLAVQIFKAKQYSVRELAILRWDHTRNQGSQRRPLWLMRQGRKGGEFRDNEADERTLHSQ